MRFVHTITTEKTVDMAVKCTTIEECTEEHIGWDIKRISFYFLHLIQVAL